MVSLSTFYNNITTLINQYVYTKEETKENFDNFIENEIRYINGNFIINEEAPPIFFINDDCTGTNIEDIWLIAGTNASQITYTTKNEYNVLYMPNNCTMYATNIQGDIEISFDYYPTNIWTWQYVYYVNDNKESLCHTRLSSSYDVSGGTLNTKNLGYNKWITVKITYINNILTLYINGIEINNTSCDYSNGAHIGFGNSYPCYYKNIKIQAVF